MTFDDISYSKGGSIIRMIHGVLGDKIFTQGLHNYLEKNKFGSATYTMLFDSWQELVDAGVEMNVRFPEGTDIYGLF